MKHFLFWVLFYSLITQADSITREQLSELHQIRSEIKSAVFDRARFQQDILKGQLDIESQNQELSKNQSDTDDIREKIIGRIANIYKIKRAYPQGSILTFVKEEDFLRKSYYLKYLNNQDKNLISEYKSKTETTNRLKKKIQNYMNHLLQLQKKNEVKFAELSKREDRQRELIRSIKAAIRAQRPEDQSKGLEDKKFFSELHGQLLFPIKGELRGALGISRDPKTKLTTLKTGLIMTSKPGAEVHSISDGEVLYIDEISGWGPTIIIDHGESYYSVYSHLKNLSVRPGDRVITQQKLAEVSGVAYHNQYSDQGLYFEIRHYSEPEDPRYWLKGEQQ